ncbi:hypothetical protein GCM10010277_20880 [Streptomyces longisporoflavus]|nr:hypothetical protein GCM10010277_20880 [Streptomyces longisporoflavus]
MYSRVSEPWADRLPEVAGMAEQDDGAGFLRCLGQQLKLLRERAGLTRAELGSRLGYGEDQITSVELGRRIPKPELIDRADEVLNAGGVLRAMKEEVARARYPAFFRDAARLEAEAVELQTYDTHVVNGLLQTEEYTRALLTMRRPLLNEETIEQRVAARLARQEIFNKWPAPLFSFVMEESVLLRRLGGASVLRGQLEQILLIGQKTERRGAGDAARPGGQRRCGRRVHVVHTQGRGADRLHGGART